MVTAMRPDSAPMSGLTRTFTCTRPFPGLTARDGEAPRVIDVRRGSFCVMGVRASPCCCRLGTSTYETVSTRVQYGQYHHQGRRTSAVWCAAVCVVRPASWHGVGYLESQIVLRRPSSMGGDGRRSENGGGLAWPSLPELTSSYRGDTRSRPQVKRVVSTTTTEIARPRKWEPCCTRTSSTRSTAARDEVERCVL